MKTYLSAFVLLLLTLGTAVASSMLRDQSGQTPGAAIADAGWDTLDSDVSEATLSALRASAKTSDFITPKVPL